MVLNSGAVPLRQFVTKMASGATPAVAEYEKYYATEADGIPFIRVQNLKETGVLKLSDTKFINDFTHQNALKRSQVSENDLLVKITGVGRMAVASVPPIGFVGNINQHSVVIKTESRNISKQLAAFLNSDIGEKLASRRATGGTRPALDYPALRSIPVICDERILNIAESARKEKNQKEQEAKELLASIDVYLLGELGINLPEQEDNTIENRSFRTSYNKLCGNRLDPKKYSNKTEALYESIENSEYPNRVLKSLITHASSGDWGDEVSESFNNELYQKSLVLRSTEFSNDFNLNIDGSRVKYRLISRNKIEKLDIRTDDLLLEKSGGSPDQPVGRIAILTKDLVNNNNLGYSNFIHKFRVDSEIIYPNYAFAFLKTMHNIKLTDTMQSQTNGIRNLIMSEYWNQIISLPPLEKQIEIANQFFYLKLSAEQLLINAANDFENAKQQIEDIILNQN